MRNHPGVDAVSEIRIARRVFRLRLAALVLFTLTFPALTLQPAHATQIIYLKSGNSITGDIIEEESTGDYYIVNVFTGKIPVRKSNVARIMEGQVYVEAHAQAEAYQQRRQWISAALAYQKAINNTDDTGIQAEFRKQIETITLEILGELKQGNPQKLPLDQCLVVAQHAENAALFDQMERYVAEARLEQFRSWMDAGKNAFRFGNYDQALQYFNQIIAEATDNWAARQEARHQRAEVFIERATSLYLSKREDELQQAVVYLHQALEVMPDHDRANYMLGRAYRRFDHHKAVEYLTKVKDSKDLSGGERQWVRNFINRKLAFWESQRKKKQASLQPQAPAGGQGFTDSMVNRFKEMFQGLGIDVSKENSGAYWQQTKVLLPLIFWALMAVLGAWYLPYRMVKWHSAKQQALKRDYVRIARRTGIFGFVFYFLGVLFSGSKRTKVTCPHCGKSLDSPSVFEDWNFNRCPYCRKTIKAPYRMQDYIRILGEKIAQDRARAAEGKKGRDASTVGIDSTLKIIRAIITYAVKLRSSDVHIEQEDAEHLLFRFRIDGVLHDGVRLPVSLHSLIITAVKNLGNLDIAERRIPQDGHFSMMVNALELNIRVATTPTRSGEKAVMRLLVPQETTLQLTELGFAPEGLMKYEKSILSPHGIILATGPTGSGKSTTLYSSLAILADGQRNVVTIEDPIEYEISGVTQTQVHTKAGLTFGTALRSILRQDPDVIMVGEIRDQETAEIACSAALTGHLVFSTLHTIDSCTALSRLIDLGIEPRQVASAVVAIVAQRLARKICPKCKKAYRPRDEELKKIGLTREKIGEQARFYYGTGCDECQKTGYLGRTGLFEVLMVKSSKGSVERALEAGAMTSAIRLASRQDGMRTLREEGIAKVLDGITTVAEILRVTQAEISSISSEVWQSGEIT